MEIKWSSPKAFNLIPPHLLKQQERRKILISFALTALVIAGLFAFVSYQFPRMAEAPSNQTIRNPSMEPINLTQAQWDLLKSRSSFFALLTAMADAVQGEVRLTSFTYAEESKSLSLFGEAPSTEAVSNFASRLAAVPTLTEGRILSLNRDRDKMRFKWEGRLP